MTRPRQEIRREMRQRRRALPPEQRRRSAHAALRQILSLIRLRRGMHLAVYLPMGGELDTSPLIEMARQRGCHVYVPIVRRARQPLRFVALEGPLRRNRFGISEPLYFPHKARDPRALDVVVMPLVAFDKHGSRLGSGAGFYDQTFAFLRLRHTWRKPQLIGYAYHWQEVAMLANEVWDVPMTAVASDRGAHRFTRR